MNVDIKALNFTAADHLEAYIKKKVDKLDHFFENILSAEVHLRAEPVQQVENKSVNIKIDLPGANLFAERQAKTFEAATDLVVDALQVQIKKHKEKIKGI